eukprot:4250239-Pyramimonas_sp.AAC.1
MRAPPLGPSVELLMGHKTVYCAQEPNAGSAIGTFGGYPYEATKRCIGRMSRTRVPPLGPS